MDHTGPTRAVGKALVSYTFQTNGKSRPEEIAQKRFFEKMELPSNNLSDKRRREAAQVWKLSDEKLVTSYNLDRLLTPNWAKAKLFIAKVLKDFKLGPVSFSNGSEFTPTLGFNSIESKLSRSEWTCTLDNFDLWVKTLQGHHGLRFAMKRRYAKLLAKLAIDKREFDRKLYLRWKHHKDFKERIFKFKAWMVTTMVNGNRFTTVPKNNIKDRSICVEPLANILTQRRIGNGIRTCLQHAGVDLNTTAEKHRSMISVSSNATIDLSNASDSIALALVKYLLPRSVFSLIEQARSEMTLDLDDNFVVIKKVSSMGNGFTFELLSLILLGISRSCDEASSVFGDDIIVGNQYARGLVTDLEAAGFEVNVKKTHIDSDYRESCGAHFLDGFGYVESYDFRYPKSIADVITIINKLSRLASIYPSFLPLYQQVCRATPAALHAASPSKARWTWRRQLEAFDSPKLDQIIVPSILQPHGMPVGIPMTRKIKGIVRKLCRDLQLDPRGATLRLGYEWVDAGQSPSVIDSRRDWAKYMMYLASGRRCVNTVRGKGAFKSFKVLTLNDETSFRLSTIVSSKS